MAFLLLALLAGLVVRLAALRAQLPGLVALNLGALVFLGQCGVLALLAACGVATPMAQATALGVGVAASWAPG
ncbi:hypothetical protein ACFQU2_36000 [Siccirubricoccus deserti]|uniref:Uncharacterized protein n=1 Tax=Siccirubricoccus deserti TaxID=2013562 RepID=A0A9X0R2E2_9PROT|nr:hypothetical protein [Siccirubricoccus deserti]MBC4018320.1 hypothetical protein [Siccirubricoccus deserti]